jgi:hypothetical protein
VFHRKDDTVLVEFNTNASDLHRACVCLATELAQLPEITDDPVHFNITPKGLEITIEGTSATLRAEVRNSGAASIPFTVLAGVLHMLPYFGKNTVEIGFSHGKMRVDTTVFHNRSILLAGTPPNERRPSSLSSILQPA